ncbi:MAG TPA: hypothetical protein VFU88_04025 [Ktedonobacterales bacterium]|nr:hypothetical protein [Ktedonobacterales bacterium]
MSWPTDTISPRAVQSSHRWRRIGVALLMGLALIIAACGTTTGGGGRPTPTSKPSPTATPVPCTGWRIVASPTNTRYPNSSLSAVSALSPSSAWAVGVNYSEGDTIGPVDSLIEQWDGSAWRVVANSGHGTLNGIAAISPRDIWAVGGQLNYSAGAGALLMHWDGTTWSVVPSAQPAGAKFATLSGVAAIASDDVWAVGGQQIDDDGQRPAPLLVEHWDGASWQIVSSPPLPPSAAPNNGGSFTAVTRIPGTNQLWAVGDWHAWINLGRGQPLIEHWTGTAWQVVPSPALPKGAMGGGWNSVVALSVTNAWAVGSYASKSSPMDHPLIAHWDGTRWQNVMANPDVYGNLHSVAAAGANDARAAGLLMTGPGASSGTGHVVPLIEQWNGTSWQIVTTPALPSGAFLPSDAPLQRLHIATDGAGNYWAVGSYLTQPTSNQYQTLPLTLHCP